METNYERIYGYEPIRKASRFTSEDWSDESTLFQIMKSSNYEQIYRREPIQKQSRRSRLINY